MKKSAFLIFLICVQEVLADFLEEFESDHSTDTSYYSSSTAPFVPASSDRLQFGRMWASIKEIYGKDEFYRHIRARREESKVMKEHWKNTIEAQRDGNLQAFYEEIELILKVGHVERINKGGGSAYYLFDELGLPRFILKSVDEDILCLNNCKFYGTPFNDRRWRVRDDIPLYRSHQTDVLAYEVACELNLPNITPKTVMSIVYSSAFFDLSDLLEDGEKDEFLMLCGNPDKEKLCSIQRYAANSISFYDLLQGWLEKEMSDEEIKSRLDQADIEDAFILIWTIFDNDAHAGNFLAYEKSTDANGFKIYGIIKIDNGLSFPEKNSSLENFLAILPNAQEKPSKRAKELIAKIPISNIIEKTNFFELENCIAAFEQRIRVLQLLIQREDITLSEIDLRMRALELEDGMQIALSDLKFEELQKLIWEELSFTNPLGSSDETN